MAKKLTNNALAAVEWASRGTMFASIVLEVLAGRARHGDQHAVYVLEEANVLLERKLLKESVERLMNPETGMRSIVQRAEAEAKVRRRKR